jgi:hypothetical protein
LLPKWFALAASKPAINKQEAVVPRNSLERLMIQFLGMSKKVVRVVNYDELLQFGCGRINATSGVIFVLLNLFEHRLQLHRRNNGAIKNSSAHIHYR